MFTIIWAVMNAAIVFALSKLRAELPVKTRRLAAGSTRHPVASTKNVMIIGA